MSDETPTDPAPDPLIAILNELNSAIECQAEMVLSIGRLIARNGWESEKAVREATVVAGEAARAARAAEAAVNVFSDNSGALLANIKLLRGEVKNVFSRIAGLEMAVDDQLEAQVSVTERKPSGGNGNGNHE